MRFVQTRDVSGVVSGTTVRIDVPIDSGSQQTIIATAHASGSEPRVSVRCSGTNRVISNDGRTGVSATQIFAVDPGFAAWIEAKVEGTSGSFALVLAVTTA